MKRDGVRGAGLDSDLGPESQESDGGGKDGPHLSHREKANSDETEPPMSLSLQTLRFMLTEHKRKDTIAKVIREAVLLAARMTKGRLGGGRLMDAIAEAVLELLDGRVTEESFEEVLGRVAKELLKKVEIESIDQLLVHVLARFTLKYAARVHAKSQPLPHRGRGVLHHRSALHTAEGREAKRLGARWAKQRVRFFADTAPSSGKQRTLRQFHNAMALLSFRQSSGGRSHKMDARRQFGWSEQEYGRAMRYIRVQRQQMKQACNHFDYDGSAAFIYGATRFLQRVPRRRRGVGEG